MLSPFVSFIFKRHEIESAWIQTLSPLPDVKAWFIPDSKDALENIYDLKEALCRRVPGLKTIEHGGQSLVLLLEGFELLSDSPFSAVRDGDLISVKLLPSAAVPDAKKDVEPERETTLRDQRKRKRSISVPKSLSRVVSPPKLSKPEVKAVEPSEDSDSDSDSSTSSSSSSSSSDLSSAPFSAKKSSTKSSSRDSSSLPELTPSPPVPSSPVPAKKPFMARTLPAIPTASAGVIHIPPGSGKPTTKARNKRRRERLAYEKELIAISQTPITPPKASSYTNALPLGNRPAAIAAAGPLPPPSTPPKAIASTSSNNVSQSYLLPPTHAVPVPPRKKARTRRDVEGPGFDVASALNNAFGQNAESGEYTGLLPEKDSEVHDYITQDQVMMGSLRNKNKKKGFMRSITKPIPKKIVFSTIEKENKEVEGEVQRMTEQFNFPNRSGQQQPSQPYLVPPSEIQERGQLPSNMFVTTVDVEEGMWAKAAKRKGRKKQNANNQFSLEESYEQEQDSTILNHNSHSEGAPAGVPLDYGTEFDWDGAERLWAKNLVVKSLDELTVGSIVGWKALALNPQTYTPELLLHAAKVVKAEGHSAVVRMLLRVGNSKASFNFVVPSAAGEDEELEDQEESTFNWDEVVAAKWRLLV